MIISSEAAGRLLGLATDQPQAVAVLEDLIVAGQGLTMPRRPAVPEEVGGAPHPQAGELQVALVRAGARIAFHDRPRYSHIKPATWSVVFQE